MTFWLDAHLSPDLAPWLGSRFGVVVKTLDEVGLREAKDHEICQAIRRIGSPVTVITKDVGFVDLVRRQGTPPQVVWLTVGNTSAIALQIVLASVFQQALDRLQAGEPIVQIS
jgi:predicted nuclease of predicted toxin-antitoxin system